MEVSFILWSASGVSYCSLEARYSVPELWTMTAAVGYVVHLTSCHGCPPNLDIAVRALIPHLTFLLESYFSQQLYLAGGK